VPKLIVICGPTATGKTEVAFSLAKKMNSEIISFDSIQVFKRFNIGAAKPPPNYLKEIKHHLIDEIEPHTPFTAGDFRRQATQILQASDREYMVLVGGTGFYLQALLKGMHEIPEVSAETKIKLQEDLALKGLVPLFKELQSLDPEYTKKIHINDQYRIVRALELLYSGSKTVTEINESFESSPPLFSTQLIGLRRKREVLRTAVESRTNFMLRNGLVDEVRGLIRDFSTTLKPLQSVGYREVTQFLNGEIKEEELESLITTSTLQLAKRQATWFKRDQETKWHDPDEEGVETIVRNITSGLT
jgi:tRNA dimethylallyltransferase